VIGWCWFVDATETAITGRILFLNLEVCKKPLLQKEKSGKRTQATHSGLKRELEDS
jgi:hypothetical protein